MASDSPTDSVISAPAAPAVPAKRPLEVAAKALAVPTHLLAGAKALRGWDDLFDVSDIELKLAVAEVANIRIGG
jgi:hypothetical protein